MANIRLSVSEAAKLFGVSQRTIRRALEDRHLEAITVQGRYKISFPSLLQWTNTKAAGRRKLATEGIGQYVDRWKVRDASPVKKSDLAGDLKAVGGK